MSNLKRILYLTLPASEVKMGPPVGTIMGQFSVKIKEFCDAFNTKTEVFPKGMPVKSKIEIYSDKTFKIKILNVPLNFLIKIDLNKKKEISIKSFYKAIRIINVGKKRMKFIKESLSFIKLNNIKIKT